MANPNLRHGVVTAATSSRRAHDRAMEGSWRPIPHLAGSEAQWRQARRRGLNRKTKQAKTTITPTDRNRGTAVPSHHLERNPLRRAKPKICTVPGCPNIDCQEHQRPAWRNARERRPRTMSGWADQERARRVMRRHGRVCHVCGREGADQVDHVIPLARGGADDESNLRPIHAVPCHKAKTQREAVEGRNHPAG